MEMIFACVISFAATALLGGKLILPALRRLKAGQEIREEGPKWHATKAGTPTMGGLMFIAGIVLAILIAGFGGMMSGDFTGLYVFLFAAVFGVIGFLDDYQKVKKHQNLGLTALQKFCCSWRPPWPSCASCGTRGCCPRSCTSPSSTPAST